MQGEVTTVINPVAGHAEDASALPMVRVRNGVAIEADEPAAVATGTHNPQVEADTAEPTPVQAEAKGLLTSIDKIDLAALEEVVERMKRAKAELGRPDVSAADVSRAKGVMSDLAATQELLLRKTVEAIEEAEQPLPHRLGKRQRQLDWGLRVDSVLEVSNLGFDVAFLTLDLWGHDTLFGAAASFLGVSLLARLWFGLQERQHVDWDKHRWRYCGGLALSLVDPGTGGRLIKRSFKKGGASGAMSWDDAQGKMVDDDRDPLAVQAANDAAAARAEAKTNLVLVLAEDVPGFVIQVLFTLESAEEQGAGALMDPVLLLTAFTTLVHAVKQLTEAWQLLRHELPELERVARARDKAFAKDAVDSDVVTFAKQAGAEHVRKMSLRDCGITDAAVLALAQHCTGVDYVSLAGCISITDGAVQALKARRPNATVIR